jgi:hypothetical protein
LSASGKQLVRKLEPLWEILNATSVDLDTEAGHVIAALDRLDAALNRVSLYERVRRKQGAVRARASKR